jgi:hypothetical protein
MPWWLWFLLPAVAVAALVLRSGKRPAFYRHRPIGEFDRALWSFLGQVDTGDVLTFDRETGPGFLQFAITENHPTSQTIEFGLPDTAWTVDAFPRVVAGLDAAGFTCTVEDFPPGAVIRRFLRVPVSGSQGSIRERADQRVGVVCRELNWPPTDRFTVHMKGRQHEGHS